MVIQTPKIQPVFKYIIAELLPYVTFRIKSIPRVQISYKAAQYLHFPYVPNLKSQDGDSDPKISINY